MRASSIVCRHDQAGGGSAFGCRSSLLDDADMGESVGDGARPIRSCRVTWHPCSGRLWTTGKQRLVSSRGSACIRRQHRLAQKRYWTDFSSRLSVGIVSAPQTSKEVAQINTMPGVQTCYALPRTPAKATALMRHSSRHPDASACRRHLNCPRCGLSILVQPYRAAIRHCPRCVGRNRVIVELFGSTLPAGVLYDENSLPRADGESPRSSRIAATDNPPYSGAPHDRAQAPDEVSGAEPLAPIAKRPIALSPSAIGE